MAELFAAALGTAGHDVDHSVTSEGALHRARRHDYDLVLMDFALPGELDGAETAVKLRDQGFRGPILAVTGALLKPDPVAAARAGFATVLRKPILPTELVDAVAAVLAQ